VQELGNTETCPRWWCERRGDGSQGHNQVEMGEDISSQEGRAQFRERVSCMPRYGRPSNETDPTGHSPVNRMRWGGSCSAPANTEHYWARTSWPRYRAYRQVGICDSCLNKGYKQELCRTAYRYENCCKLLYSTRYSGTGIETVLVVDTIEYTDTTFLLVTDTRRISYVHICVLLNSSQY
jgi:hypothetical protein